MENQVQWWHENLNSFAEQLPKGVLNEMKLRIENGNIRKEKIMMNEDTDRIKEFFNREIERYKKRLNKQDELQKSQKDLDLKLEEVQELEKKLIDKEEKYQSEIASLKKQVSSLTAEMFELNMEHEIKDASIVKAINIIKYFKSTESGRKVIGEYVQSKN